MPYLLILQKVKKALIFCSDEIKTSRPVDPRSKLRGIRGTATVAFLLEEERPPGALI